jgi:hypothetical protein
MVIVIGQTFLSGSFIYTELASVFKVYHSIEEAIEALNTNCDTASNDNYNRILIRKEPVRIVQLPLQIDTE